MCTENGLEEQRAVDESLSAVIAPGELSVMTADSVHVAGKSLAEAEGCRAPINGVPVPLVVFSAAGMMSSISPSLPKPVLGERTEHAKARAPESPLGADSFACQALRPEIRFFVKAGTVSCSLSEKGYPTALEG